MLTVSYSQTHNKQKSKHRMIGVILILMSLMVLSISVVSADTNSPTADTTIVVFPADMKGWVFSDDGLPTDGGEMVFGPTGHFGQNGSAELECLAGARSVIKSPDYEGTRFDAITSRTYDAYRSSSNDALNDTSTPYFNFDVDYDLTDGPDLIDPFQGRLVWSEGSLSSDSVWENFNPWDPSARWRATRPPSNPDSGINGLPDPLCDWGTECTIAELLTVYPDAGVAVREYFSTIEVKPGYVVLKGCGGTDKFHGNVDELVIGVDDGAGINTTTYDFEPEEPTAISLNQLTVGEQSGFVPLFLLFTLVTAFTAFIVRCRRTT